MKTARKKTIVLFVISVVFLAGDVWVGNMVVREAGLGVLIALVLLSTASGYLAARILISILK